MISVIVPIYNVEKYIVDCIRSIVDQTYRDFELILVDDGSTDKSITYAENTVRETKDIDIKIIKKSNGGVSSARNAGIEAAKGDHIIMIDSDDVLAPGFLDLYRNMIDANPSCDIYSSGFKVCFNENDKIYEDSKKQDEYQALSWNEAQIDFFSRTIKFLLPTLLLKKQFLDINKIRFDENVRYSEDVQFIWRCLAYNRNNILHSTAEYYHYILHSGSTMTASGLTKIKTGISGVDRLYLETREKYCEEIRDAFLPRQYFSILHGASKMISYQLFSKLYRENNCSIQIKKHLVSKSLKLKAVTFMLLYCRPIGYYVLRKA